MAVVNLVKGFGKVAALVANGKIPLESFYKVV
jgi:hypothetical protein